MLKVVWGLGVWKPGTDYGSVKAAVVRGSLNTVVIFRLDGPWTVTQKLNCLLRPRLESGGLA